MYPIIIAIDDQDVYKKYMQFFLLKKNLGDIVVEYSFFNRGKTKFTPNFKLLLEEQLEYMSFLKWSKFQLDHLKEKCPFLNDDYIYNFLPTTYFDPSAITINLSDGNLELSIKIRLNMQLTGKSL